MRVLTVRQPWAWAILHGGKDVENRVRNIAGDYRGPVAIHAGQAMDLDAFSGRLLALTEAVERDTAAKPDPLAHGSWFHHRGCILGVVDLVGVHRGTVTQGARAQQVASCFRAGKPFGLCSSWAEHDAWHLELANPRPLAEPIPFRGALGLRTLDPGVEALVQEELR